MQCLATVLHVMEVYKYAQGTWVWCFARLRTIDMHDILELHWLSTRAMHRVHTCAAVLCRPVCPAGVTDPALAMLVYICNSSITTYDVTAGRATPSSHSLPDSKLPQVRPLPVNACGLIIFQAVLDRLRLLGGAWYC